MISAWLLVALSALPVGAQQTRTFVARLSTVPITVAMQDTVAGRGVAKAVLTGNKLTVDGTFEGLRSPATVARIHLAPRALRGPAVLDLMVSRGTSGRISGSLELSPRQREALEKGSLYIQLHSEKAPDGNLWGWLLPQEATR
jgi:CHRD domain